ncbi:hypothetical protein MXD61_24440 [Frankia sp. AgPm24]|uniref:hypothetical protein n=1 Tax=Frankia sp. AgPm24 TaxID=631128 RepID=UPI00200CA2E0|nr:hypothetical protein [Frankia sp. AgPm24]
MREGTVTGFLGPNGSGKTSSVALLTLIGAGAFELAFDGARFHGPATAVLGVLAWPTSELEGTSLVAAVGWGGLALGGALLAVRRDLAT